MMYFNPDSLEKQFQHLRGWQLRVEYETPKGNRTYEGVLCRKGNDYLIRIEDNVFKTINMQKVKRVYWNGLIISPK